MLKKLIEIITAMFAPPAGIDSAAREMYGHRAASEMGNDTKEALMSEARIDAGECGWTRAVLKRHGVTQ